MGQPAAKKGDKITATDTHIVITPPDSAPKPLPHPFSGAIDGSLSTDVKIMGEAAAVVGSTASNNPAHVPTAPGTSFQNSPSNKATIKMGSSTVFINGKAAARNGDKAETCNDPTDMSVGTVVASGTVMIG